MPAKDKITVSLGGEALATVSALAASNQISQSEVVRRAIALLQMTEQETADGSHLLLRRPNGDVERIRFVYAG